MSNLKVFLYIILFLASIQSFDAMAQNNATKKTEELMVQYYNISVGFYSIGQGTNNQAQDELFEYINKLQKKFKVVLPYERIYWGKEGEKTIYMDVSQLPAKENQNFLIKLSEMYRDRNKMAIVQASLCYDPYQQKLTMGIMLYGQNKSREDTVLNYIEEYEKKNNIKINNGYMINETGIIEDQDKRYQFSLNQLTESQKTEVIQTARKLMKVIP